MVIVYFYSPITFKIKADNSYCVFVLCVRACVCEGSDDGDGGKLIGFSVNMQSMVDASS